MTTYTYWRHDCLVLVTLSLLSHDYLSLTLGMTYGRMTDRLIDQQMN